MKGKKIYAVLHGDKLEGPNPSMTVGGFSQIRSLKRQLPTNISTVICGTGLRHMQVCRSLGLTMTRSTFLLGDATSMDMVNGQPKIVFADGSFGDYGNYTSIQDIAPIVPNFLKSLPDQTILCTGRPFAKALGIKAAKSGSVIEINIYDDKVDCSILEQLGESEI